MSVSWEAEPFTCPLKLKQGIADPKDLVFLSEAAFFCCECRSEAGVRAETAE